MKTDNSEKPAMVTIGLRVEREKETAGRDVLADYLRSLVDGCPDIVLSLDLPCGEHYECKDYEDLPYESVPCTCGDPGHWFIKYETRDYVETEC